MMPGEISGLTGTRIETLPPVKITPEEVEEISSRLDQTATEVANLAKRVQLLVSRIREAKSRPAPEARSQSPSTS